MTSNALKISRAFFAILTIISIMAGCGPVTPIPNSGTSEPASLPAPTTSSVQPSDAQSESQEVWLDETVNLKQFSPTGTFIVHFKSSISPTSSVIPIFTWPNVEGTSSWNENLTILTFKPSSLLDSKKTYTFFLDPALQFADGSSLKKTSEWTVYVQSGPKILGVIPSAGTLSQFFKTIEIKFDRDMRSDDVKSALTIQPPVPHEIKWKDARILQIKLQQPLATNQRYDLTLKSSELFARDGSYLTEDYHWFYWQGSFDISAALTGKRTINFNFSYALDKEKTGLPFTIYPELNGKWSWLSSQKLLFTANEVVPSSTKFELKIISPLVEENGFEISQIPTTVFSGLPPIHLERIGIEKKDYSDILIADANLDAIRLKFDISVNHSSAETAFSLTPAIPGKFQWEAVGSTSQEILVYMFDELLDSSTVYTLKMNTGLLDSKGNKVVAQSYQQQFQRQYWNYLTPSFGEAGDNIQVIGANGSRRLQISGSDPDISFTAYSFDLSKYAALYGRYYHSRSQGNVLDIPIPSDSNPMLTWRSVSTREVEGDSIIETIIPPDLLPGLYVVNLNVKNRLYDQLFLVISHNTMIVKNDGDNLYVWVTDINGGVVANAEVRVYSTMGEKIREGQTDENGYYKVAIPTSVEPSLVSAFVQVPGKPNDAIITGFGPWYSYFPYNYVDILSPLPEGKPYLTYIYTERPLYRPGQTVNFKVITRKDDDMKYSLLETGTPIDVRIKDARDNTIQSYELTTNEFGTVNDSVDISEGAMLGLYKIEAEVGGVVSQEVFKVEDYRKPDYQITLTSLQPEKQDRFVRDEEVKVQVNAAYYFGEPLINAKLDVNFFITWPINTKVTGSLTTDENGNAAISFKAPYDGEDYYYSPWSSRQESQSVRMEVSIDDGSNQMVTGVYNFQVHPASEILNLDTSGYYFQPNKPFIVAINDTDLFDQPVEGREITLTTHTWNRTSFEFDTANQSFMLQTNSQGIATQEIALNAGYYKIMVSAKDGEGRKMEVSRWVYIFKDKYDWYYWNREEQVQISAERESYKPYEKARFMIESTFSGPALVTFERGSVINSKMIELAEPLTILETDIIPEHAPNVYVTVNAWQAASEGVYRYEYQNTWQTQADTYLRLAQTKILVDASTKELDISITTEKQTYEPGETVTATINVKDAEGNPTLAELSLAVVDEAIFGLANEFAPNIFDAFYGPRKHTVDTSNSMAPYRIIMTGGQGGGGDIPPQAARSSFLDTSAWLPVIQTDENGKGIVTFNLPDNTTSWRLTIKAVSLMHHVGQATANIESKKAVFIRPVLPRILTHGDQATLTAFIHNYSEQEKTLTVHLASDGLEIQGSNDESITLQAGEVMPIGWRVLVNRSAPTMITITARESDDVLDIIELPLLIQPSAVRDIQSQSGEFSSKLELKVALPNVDMETSRVLLTLNQSISGTLLTGLEYLTGYPYGCVEQTMSRALPNAVVGRASEQLGIGGPALQEQLKPLIQASIMKLYGLQHSDGGWGWWTDDISDEYQSAWVLFGLGVLNDSGYTIEPKVMDNAADWLTQSFDYEKDFDIRTRAYTLYSLAMADRGELEVTQNLVSMSINELDPFSQAALASALNRMGEDEQARRILNLLSQSAVLSGDLVYWPQPNYDGEYHRKTMASTIRTTAMALLAYTEIDPQNELIPGIVAYLSSQRKGVYGWGTTNETSFTILALTEHLISEEKELGSTPYTVSVNGGELFTGTLEAGNTNATLEVPVSALEYGVNSFLISTEGNRSVYFDLSTQYDLLQQSTDAAGKIKITRQYLDPETNKPLQAIQAGQLVEVKLSVNPPEDAFYIAVEDHLPGGLEPLNEGLNATTQASFDRWGWENYVPFFWAEYGYNYKEIRGDRVVFFITTMDKGRHTLTYYARATTSGHFTALPTQVYAMYDLSMWGRSESAEILIK